MDINILREISWEDFAKVQICTGTILQAKMNHKARLPAYVLTIDFGEQGIKTSSAQITENYVLEDLIGQQVVAVMNFPSKRVAGVKSEVLVLACVSDVQGTVLLQPTKAIDNGTRVL